MYDFTVELLFNYRFFKILSTPNLIDQQLFLVVKYIPQGMPSDYNSLGTGSIPEKIISGD